MSRGLAFLAAGLSILIASPALAAEVKAGVYDAKGTNFDGSPYSGTAKIAISSNTTCRIEWTTGGSTSTGFCMRDETSLAAAYKLGNSVGLVIYKIMDDGSLEGVWTIADKTGAGTETLTPQ
jgi:hypothetical protein